MGKEERFNQKQVKFPNQDPKKGGRPRKLVSQTIKDLKDNGITGVSKSEIEELYLVLLNSTKDELHTMLKDDNQPIIVRVVIKNILDNKGFEIIEKMLDRVIGKPLQRQENKIDTGTSIIIVENEDQANSITDKTLEIKLDSRQ